MNCEKIFGINYLEFPGGVRPAIGLKNAIDQPGHPESWEFIQKQARKNSLLYEAAFPYIPRNYSPIKGLEESPASILPTWDPRIGDKGGIGSPLPFQNEFWAASRQKSAATALSSVAGFIVDIPIHWTKDENIRIKYPTAIIVRNDGEGDLINSEKSEILVADNGMARNEVETNG